MFLCFKISNYRSIGNEIDIDFRILDSQKLGAYSEINDQTVNNIACLVGPNASGKSNILKSIVYFIRCMHRSYSMPFYRYSSALVAHFCFQGSPIKFFTEFIDNEAQYRYEISILNGIVQKEALDKRNGITKRYSNIFKREKGSVLFSQTIKMNNQDITRLGNDMSLLSLLLELNYFGSNDFLMFRNFYSNVNPFPGVTYVGNNSKDKLENILRMLQDDDILFDELIDELKTIDTGISSLQLKNTLDKNKIDATDELTDSREMLSMLTSHKIAGKDYLLSMLDESSGTLHYIHIFTSTFHVLKNGGMFIVDELEQSLHPDLTARIINRFISKDTNPNNAQLFFTTHNPWFLQDLTKTQIFITEKNNRAETKITRLDEIAGVRNDENYFTKYIAGEYDGRPKIEKYSGEIEKLQKNDPQNKAHYRSLISKIEDYKHRKDKVTFMRFLNKKLPLPTIIAKRRDIREVEILLNAFGL